jgi:integrase
VPKRRSHGRRRRTALNSRGYTVAEAVSTWLTYGLHTRDPKTVDTLRTLADRHVIASLGASKIRELTADEVDEWLAGKAKQLSTDTLRRLLSILRRSIKRAQARDKVSRNVAMVCEVPKGTGGRRPSKSMTLEQAEALLEAAKRSPMRAYIVVSLLTGARTEELRALTWNHLDLDGKPKADPPVPASIQVWRSVRASGDTKTPKSRRTLELPQRCVLALRDHRERQAVRRQVAGARWTDLNLVFASEVGTALDAGRRPALLPGSRQACGTAPQEVDALRTAAQLRVVALKQRSADRGDLTPGRSRQHERHGKGPPARV